MEDLKTNDHDVKHLISKIEDLIEENDEASLPSILSLYDEAITLDQTMKTTEATDHFVRFVDETYVPFLRRQDPPDHGGIARILAKVARLETDLERYDVAEAHLERSLQAGTKVTDPDQDDRLVRARTIHNLGYLLSVTFRHGRAMTALEDARASYDMLEGEGLDLTEDLAKVHLDMARLHDREKASDKALKSAHLALSIMERQSEPDPVIQSELYEMIALASGLKGDHEGAIQALEKLVDVLKTRQTADDQAVKAGLARALYTLAVNLLKTKDHDKADEAIGEAITIYASFEDTKGDLWQGVLAKCHVLRGSIHDDRDDVDGAIEFYEKALALFVTLSEESRRPFRNEMANLFHDLGAAYVKKGDDETALEHLEEADSRISNLVRTQTATYIGRYAKNASLLARIHQNKGHLEASLEQYGIATAAYLDLTLKDSASHIGDLVSALVGQSEALSASNQQKKASKELHKAIKRLEKADLDAPDLKTSIDTLKDRLASIYDALGKSSKARKTRG